MLSKSHDRWIYCKVRARFIHHEIMHAWLGYSVDALLLLTARISSRVKLAIFPMLQDLG